MSIIKFVPINVALDNVQLSVISRLEEIAKLFDDSSFFKFFKPKHKISSGIYIFGGVGRGKSMIMSAFFKHLNVKKTMLHYQSFMHSVHENMHKIKSNSTDHIIKKLSKEYSTQAKVLCIDEFEIKDIVDAMIVGKLFEELTKAGVFIVVTSNTEPKDLYKDGLQRESFLPFIDMLKSQFEIIHLDNFRDYRMDKLVLGSTRILFPISKKTNIEIKAITKDLIGDNELRPGCVRVFGRELWLKKTYGDILITDFEELFLSEIGYVDYVNICKTYRKIILTGVQCIKADNTDLITRLINFIDNAYFYKVALFITLAASPEEIYPEGKRIAEFSRTLSRLYEMNSDQYLEN